MSPVRRKPSDTDPVREATIGTLRDVMDQLLGLMFDAGVTVQEFNHIIRDRAVRAAGTRIIREYGRISKSRVAILTGLPRSEVSKILGSVDTPSRTSFGQSPARRVLAGWYDTPRFLADSGEPAVLPIFGKRRSFERLVSMYGSGIPVRAMLDELSQIDAVECLAEQRVRAKSRVPIFTGITTNAINAIGERCGDLLQTLMNNLRTTSPPLFEATALACDADREMVPIVRRELAAQGASFINGANAFLKRSRRRPGSASSVKSAKYRLGISVYYFEEEIDTSDSGSRAKVSRRRNLRRQRPTRKSPRSNKRRTADLST